MKLQLIRETLLEPLQTVIGVVEAKQTLPILSNVLLNLQKNTLSVTGTDLEVELIGQSQLTQDTPQDHKITLPGRKLIDICKALPENAPIELYQDKEQMIIRSGKSRFTLSTLPTEEFPATDIIKSIASFSAPQNDMLNMLKRTAFSMAQHDVRYYLNGILMEVVSGKIRCIATDGHRLAMNSFELKTQTDHRMQVIIPRKGVLELIRLLDDSEALIDVIIGNNLLRVSSTEYTFTTKLIEGRYPEYNRVIPKNNSNHITLEKSLLIKALKRSAILCNEKFRGVRIEVKKNILRILANNPEHEAAEEELQIEYTGPTIEIGFNVNYLLENLNIIQTDLVKLKLLDANNSMLIEEVNSGLDSIFVIMPMRL